MLPPSPSALPPLSRKFDSSSYTSPHLPPPPTASTNTGECRFITYSTLTPHMNTLIHRPKHCMSQIVCECGLATLWFPSVLQISRQRWPRVKNALIRPCVSFRILSRGFRSRADCSSRRRSGAGTRSGSVLDETAVKTHLIIIRQNQQSFDQQHWANYLTKRVSGNPTYLDYVHIREAVYVSQKCGPHKPADGRENGLRAFWSAQLYRPTQHHARQ